MNNRWILACCLGLFLSTSGAQETQSDAESTPPQQPVTPVPTEPAGLSIEEAYQKEFAFLEAQRQDLQRRIEQARQRNAEIRDTLKAQVDAVQNQVLSLDVEVENTNTLVNQSEDQAQVNSDNREVLAATFQQADVTLEQQNIKTLDSEAFESLDDAQKLELLFSEGLGLVQKLGEIRKENGAFYKEDGTEVQGEIMRVGNIAAYGRSGSNSGVLAPAGGGRLKLWPVPVSGQVEALWSGGASASTVPVFLFETLNKEIEAKKEKTAIDVINEGGVIGWIIVGLGLFGLLLIILRFVFLQQSSASTGKLAERLKTLVKAGNQQEALEVCRRMKSAPARVVASAIRNLDKDRDHIEDIVSESILHESAHLNRFGVFILVIAAVAPLLGLLGTVTGMISTFEIITEFGTGDPSLLSRGIAIALVTTELGLIVAIPTLMLGNLLSGWAESIKDDMEKAALSVINVSQDQRRLKAVA